MISVSYAFLTCPPHFESCTNPMFVLLLIFFLIMLVGDCDWFLMLLVWNIATFCVSVH